MIEEKELELELEPSQKNNEDFWKDLEMQDSRRRPSREPKSDSQEQILMLSLLKNSKIVQPKAGHIFNGVYLGGLGGQHCFSVDGIKDSVYIENRPLENKYLRNSKVGDCLDLLITNIDENDYYISGSISAIYESRAHETLKALDEDLIVMVNVRSLNPAGYDVDILHDGVTLPGFMPNTLAGINKLHDQNSIVGASFEAMIESFSEQEGTYIISRKKYLKTLIPAAMDELEAGELYTGVVTGTTPFGVFVEFNECLTGMIYKSNISEDWRDRISDIRPGMKIEFYVKEIAKEKIILTQSNRETLWDVIKIGQIIDGTVRDNKKFGSLISLDEETMGLIHNSELEKSGRKFTAGQEVSVKVIALDRQSRKIFLSVA